MPSTKSRAKLGRTTFWVTIERREYDEESGSSERYVLKFREVRSRNEAEKILNEAMPLYAKATTHDVVGEVRKGTYVDNSFDDDTYGHISDAVWVEDEAVHIYAWMNDRMDPKPEIEWVQE